MALIMSLLGGDMRRSIYDSNKDGVIAVAQTEAKNLLSVLSIDQDLDMGANKILTNIIDEKTGGVGVTIDKLLCKDGLAEYAKKGGVLIASVSDDLRKSDDTEESTTSTSFVKIKEIVIPPVYESATLRIAFDLSSQQTGEVDLGRAKITKNGADVGTDRNNTSIYPAFDNFSEDIAGFTGGDKVELRMVILIPPYLAYCRNFRVYCIDSLAKEVW